MFAAYMTGLLFGVFIGVVLMSILSINRAENDLCNADDKARLDHLTDGKRSLTYHAGGWAVVQGVPPSVIGEIMPTPRDAIDSARALGGEGNG